MRTNWVVIVTIIASVAGCDAGPTDPTATLPADIRDFLKSDPALVVRSGAVVLSDRSADITVFRVSYGEPQDCQSGCFYSSAIGLRVGRQSGWVDGIGQSVPNTSVFRLQPMDSLRFTTAYLDELKARDGSAFGAVAFVLACSPNVAAPLREKLRRENPSLPVPLLCQK